MVTTTLVERDIENGRQVIRALDKAGITVRSALWLHDRESGDWRFLLAMPLVDKDGPLSTYKRIREILAEQSIDIPVWSIGVMGSTEAFPRTLKLFIKTTPKAIDNIRFSGVVIGNKVVDDAYIYRSA